MRLPNGSRTTFLAALFIVGSVVSFGVTADAAPSTWTVQTTPNPNGAAYNYLSGVSCVSATACSAVGNYDLSSGGTKTLAERWNGTDWAVKYTPNPTGATTSYLNGLSCTSATACTAVGYYHPSSGGTKTLVERRNGANWAVTTTPNPTGNSYLSGVSCASATACTAVGHYSGSGG
ncbi:MAG: hypothetical protein ABIR57_04835, partial [Aeromicrobium sp.]